MSADKEPIITTYWPDSDEYEVDEPDDPQAAEMLLEQIASNQNPNQKEKDNATETRQFTQDG